MGKARKKQAKTGENRRKTGAFWVLIFWGGKLVGANFYAFCNYVVNLIKELILSFHITVILTCLVPSSPAPSRMSSEADYNSKAQIYSASKIKVTPS